MLCEALTEYLYLYQDSEFTLPSNQNQQVPLPPLTANEAENSMDRVSAHPQMDGKAQPTVHMQ